MAHILIIFEPIWPKLQNLSKTYQKLWVNTICRLATVYILSTVYSIQHNNLLCGNYLLTHVFVFFVEVVYYLERMILGLLRKTTAKVLNGHLQNKDVHKVHLEPIYIHTIN